MMAQMQDPNQEAFNLLLARNQAQEQMFTPTSRMPNRFSQAISSF